MKNSYEKLDSRVQKWVYQQGWHSLRDIQQEAIDPILAGDTDVIISASTAAGKTEAFSCPPAQQPLIITKDIQSYI